jgi:hypothetical protein
VQLSEGRSRIRCSDSNVCCRRLFIVCCCLGGYSFSTMKTGLFTPENWQNFGIIFDNFGRKQYWNLSCARSLSFCFCLALRSSSPNVFRLVFSKSTNYYLQYEFVECVGAPKHAN